MPPSPVLHSKTECTRLQAAQQTLEQHYQDVVAQLAVERGATDSPTARQVSEQVRMQERLIGTGILLNYLPESLTGAQGRQLMAWQGDLVHEQNRLRLWEQRLTQAAEARVPRPCLIA